MIFWRGKASYLYSTAITIRGSQRKPREGLDRLEDDSEAFRKFPVPEGTFGKSFRRLMKLRQSHRVGPSRVESRRLELIPRTWENARASSRMTPIALGKFPVPERVSGKVSWRLLKLRQTLRVSPTRVCGIRTLYSSFGNRVQTQRSHLGQRFVALHSVQSLVISLGSVWIIQWVV